MILTKVKISDFRSILQSELYFNDRCVGLIGLNESGKSNILKALRAFDEDYKASHRDKCKISGRYPSIEYHFAMNDEELTELTSKVQNVLNEYILSTDNILFDLKNVSPFHVTVTFDPESENKKQYNTVSDFRLVLKGDFLEINNDVEQPENAIVKLGEDEYDLADISYVNAKDLTNEEAAYFKPADIILLLEELKSEILDEIYKLTPQVIFWEYQPSFLLPSELTYAELIKNNTPSTNSVPFYNILLLSEPIGVSDVDSLKRKISIWGEDASERRKDSSIINECVNQYIKSIWSDYDQELKIELEESKVTIHINDPSSNQKNYYDMESRSQGFKTFISFILTIAAQAENGIVSNFILLLDEPETHLHPSGVRFMKKQLFDLGDSGNTVLYATHSLFMIDRANLKRHVIVSKTNELTKLTPVKRANFIQEAVIYEALGTQVDEFSIGLKNIVFEGETDLKIFETYKNKCLAGNVLKQLNEYTLWDGGGTRRIDQFFNNKILPKSSHWIIVLDSDAPGKDLARKLEKHFTGNRNVQLNIVYYANRDNIELEDLLPLTIIETALHKTVSLLNLVPQFPADFTATDLRISFVIDAFKSRNRFSAEVKSLFEETFKQEINSELTTQLKKITATGNKDAKTETFAEQFPSYFSFIDLFVNTFFPDVKKTSV